VSTTAGTPGRPDRSPDRDSVAERLRRDAGRLLLGSVAMMVVFTVLTYATGVSRLWLVLAAFLVGAIAMTARSTSGSLGAMLGDILAALVRRGPEAEAQGDGPAPAN
jgi:hypothetical protein